MPKTRWFALSMLAFVLGACVSVTGPPQRPGTTGFSDSRTMPPNWTITFGGG